MLWLSQYLGLKFFSFKLNNSSQMRNEKNVGRAIIIFSVVFDLFSRIIWEFWWKISENCGKIYSGSIELNLPSHGIHSIIFEWCLKPVGGILIRKSSIDGGFVRLSVKSLSFYRWYISIYVYMRGDRKTTEIVRVHTCFALTAYSMFDNIHVFFLCKSNVSDKCQ